MKLLENKIITQIINNLNEDFNTIKNLLIHNNKILFKNPVLCMGFFFI